ncbi:MAG: phenylalanine--tRNA ligase subunit beta [Gemmatimonadales bacterium]
MKVSVNWLRELAPGIGGSPEELADHLSMTVVAVDEVHRIGAGIENVVVARVEETTAHPDADRLNLASITAGTDEPVGVVVGAPVRAGALYPHAPPGTTLPGGLKIGARKIRGQTSHGMLCSERELGLGWDHSGILELPPDLTPGEPLAEALGFPDHVLELDLTPNRADLAGHLAVARELAPEGESGLVLPSFGSTADAWSPSWIDGECEASAAGARVVIEDRERCSRFLGIVIRGLRIGPSPAWLAARLWALGGRPINNVVDATNYVMHEINHPLHAYDLATLSGPEVRVRAGREGERLRTLDGEEHVLTEVSSVIADADRAIGLAGVMGGAETEVSSTTADVFLECAVFDPLHTRRTARQAGLSTDASYRFERGVDRTDVEQAITRCARLILATAGGRGEDHAVRVGPLPGEQTVLELRPSRVRQVLGRSFDREELNGILSPIGFEPVSGSGEADQPLRLYVPGWRNDVTREIDLVEEVARRHGYNRFEGGAFAVRPSSVPDDPAWERAELVRRLFVARGYLEARSASFATERRAGRHAVELSNPLSAEESRLRTDLIASLLDRLEYNLARGRRDVRLFEIGTAFAAPGDDAPSPALPLEELHAAFVLTGDREPVHWGVEAADADLWDLKGLAEELSEDLLGGSVTPVLSDAPERTADGGLGSVARWLGGEAFALQCQGRIVGLAGRVKDSAVDAPRWAAPVWAGEFRLDAVQLDAEAAFAPLSPYPRVGRDLAIIVSEEHAVSELEKIIREACPPFLESVWLFDVYEGEEIPEGCRSLAWRFRFQADDRTLTDEEVDAAMTAVTSALEDKSDARIRTS